MYHLQSCFIEKVCVTEFNTIDGSLKEKDKIRNWNANVNEWLDSENSEIMFEAKITVNFAL